MPPRKLWAITTEDGFLCLTLDARDVVDSKVELRLTADQARLLATALEVKASGLDHLFDPKAAS